MRRLRRTQRDEGAVLVIVLLFLGVVSILCLAITEQVRASIGNTIIVRGQQGLVAAADAGIKHGLAQVRADSTSCGSGTPTTLTAPPSLDGKSITVTCSLVSGSLSGVFGYALVTTDTTGDSLVTSGGGTKVITGPLFTARSEGNHADLVVRNGDFVEKQGASSCTDSTSRPGGVTIEPAALFAYKCLNATAPTPVDVLPTDLITTLRTPNTTDSTCTILIPGKYTGSINLTGPTYMVSGTYYFENATVTLSNGARVVGGASGIDIARLGLTPCANDGAHPAATGTGVKWIMGATSSLTVASSGAQMELFTRRGGTASNDGTDGITFTQVPTTGLTAVWLPSLLGPNDLIIDESSGSNPDLAVHGIINVPRAAIQLDNVSNTSRAQFLGGVVAGRLILQNSGSGSGLAISIDTEETPRVVKLEATASSGVSGDKTIVSTAVFQMTNDSARTATTLSWRTTS